MLIRGHVQKAMLKKSIKWALSSRVLMLMVNGTMCTLKGYQSPNIKI